jgi:hypothetical protein
VSLLQGPEESKPDEKCTQPEVSFDTARIPLHSIAAVASHVGFIEEARTKVNAEMESMVLTGLMTLVRGVMLVCQYDIVSQNQALLASSLQTAYNFRVLCQTFPRRSKSEYVSRLTSQKYRNWRRARVRH